VSGIADVSIPLWANLLAVGIGSLQGAIFAAQFRDRRLDLLGVAIIGIATGFGGGLLRDLLLNEVPLALLSNWYLPVAVASALIGMLLERLFSRTRSPSAFSVRSARLLPWLRDCPPSPPSSSERCLRSGGPFCATCC